LGIAAILQCRAGAFLAAFALRCSSWCSINKGTSKRSACASIGYTDYPSVTKVSWWMRHYDGPSPKRHFMYSNSPHIRRLDKGKLQGWKASSSKAKNAIVYRDSQNRKRYKGTALLKSSEIYPIKFARCLVDLYPDLVSSARGQATLPEAIPPALDSFLKMPETSAGLEFAALEEVFNYLRRGKRLSIPARWAQYISKPQ
ncbi:unnamed protein product, partial [Durusdinium trenchii]